MKRKWHNIGKESRRVGWNTIIVWLLTLAIILPMFVSRTAHARASDVHPT